MTALLIVAGSPSWLSTAFADSPPAPPIEFVSPKAGEAIEVKTETAWAYRRLWLEVGDKPVRDVRLKVEPLHTSELAAEAEPEFDTAGVEVRVDTEVWNAARTFEAGRIVLVELRADLPRAATYRGLADLEYAGGRQVRALDFTRTSWKPSVEAHGLAPADENAGLWLTLRETGRTAVRVGRPQVLELKRAVGENAHAQANFTDLKVEILRSDSEEPQARKEAAGKPGRRWSEFRERWYPIPLGGAQELRLTFEGLSRAGRYEGTVMLPVENAEPLRASFALIVRWCWYWAAALILFGVLISALLEHLTKTLRPLLLRQREVAFLQRDLRKVVEGRSLSDPSGTQALETVQAEVDKLFEAAEAGAPTFEGDLKRVDARISLLDAWLKARSFVQGLELAIQKDFSDVLGEAERSLGARESTVEDLTAKAAALSGLEAKARTARKRILLGEIEETLAEANRCIAEAGEDQDLVGRLRDEVAAKLTKAEALLAPAAPEASMIELARNLWQQAVKALETIEKRREPQAVSLGSMGNQLPRLARVEAARQRRERPSLAQVLAKLRQIDWYVVVLAAVASLALGIKVLWADNPTWGGVDDVLVAILWGLGLHQVANSAAGYVGVRKKLDGEG